MSQAPDNLPLVHSFFGPWHVCSVATQPFWERERERGSFIDSLKDINSDQVYLTLTLKWLWPNLSSGYII